MYDQCLRGDTESARKDMQEVENASQRSAGRVGDEDRKRLCTLRVQSCSVRSSCFNDLRFFAVSGDNIDKSTKTSAKEINSRI